MTVSTARGQRSPLMFGCDVIPLHHCHAASVVQRLLHLLICATCVKLRHDGAMLRGDSSPRPVIRDPGVGQALPHDRAMTYTHTRQKDSSILHQVWTLKYSEQKDKMSTTWALKVPFVIFKPVTIVSFYRYLRKTGVPRLKNAPAGTENLCSASFH